MRRSVMMMVVVSVSVWLGQVGPAGGQIVRKDRQYPRFQVGVTGIWATIEPGLKVTVDGTMPGTPAAGKLSKGDVIVSVNGRSLAEPDPRVPLGQSLTAAEATDGRLVMQVRRGGSERQVVITIPVLGPYSKTWPLNCAKSRAIVKQAAEKLVKTQQDDGWYHLGPRQTMGAGLTGCMATLFLMSTGDDAYMPNVERYVRALAQQAQAHPTGSSWHLGYQLIVLGEYYLRIGDRSVLGAMKALAAKTPEGQIAGSWGHSMTDTSVGYVQSGQMNSAGVTVFLGLALARECGIRVSEETFQRALYFFYRMPGHGSICYGDHRAEIYPDTNGRNAAIACAMGLLEGKAYRMQAEHLAALIADSYYAPEAGHTGGGFNIIWRGIGTMWLRADQQARYRRHMEQLSWYYDLCRLPGGGFQILPSTSTRYSGPDWGYAVGLTYTAPLRNLRITGAPPTRYSVKAPALPARPWGTQRDLDFYRTDYCEGFGEEIDPPHVIYAKVTGKAPISVAYAAKMIRHFNPMIRTWAAYKLGDLNTPAAHQAIVEALQHPDPRVRRAGCDAISHYTNWGRGRRVERIAPAVVSEKFVPHLEAILNDPASAWWEIDGALWALGYADPPAIRRNMPVIRRFAAHPEWYLRESAYWAVVGLGRQITGSEFLFLADMYVKSRHVFERSSYDGGINYLIRSAKAPLDDRTIAQYVRKIGTTVYDSLIASGYDEQAAHHEATHRTMMVLNRFKNPPYQLIVPDFVRYLKTWTPNFQHSAWLITGNGWQPGLCKIALSLGKDGRPLIEALRRCQAQLPPPRNRENRQLTECREVLARTLEQYDKKYGS